MQIEFLQLAGLFLSRAGSREDLSLPALQTFSSRERIPPPAACLPAASQGNEGIMWPLTREASEKNFSTPPFLLPEHLLLAASLNCSTTQ